MENETERRAKEHRVLEAAKAVFLRHGFRRVTMQDIAQEAQISRPALYLIFPSKEEIFTTLIRRIAKENLAFIRGDLWAHSTIEAKLELAFEVWTVEPFRLMQRSPDAKDLVECSQSFAKEVMNQSYAEFDDLLAEILKPLITKPIPSPGNPDGLDALQIARILTGAAKGFKETATSVFDLQRMIAGLITLTLAAVRTAK
jgi:AcrR family transcriptional regulator